MVNRVTPSRSAQRDQIRVSSISVSPTSNTSALTTISPSVRLTDPMQYGRARPNPPKRNGVQGGRDRAHISHA
ncbi:hypothetical protein GCM10023075_04140 [Streptosporangium album]